jgi:opacity protein-like surface antigen
MARPYLIGGAGVYNIKNTVTGLGSSSDTKFGLNAGAGFDFGLGKAKLYAEGRFHMIMKAVSDGTATGTKSAYMIPLTVGVRF